MNDFTATYSPEDNKLRIYATYRLEDELYQRFKALGFHWAPRQELFVAGRWTPRREDFCIEMAGELEPEQSTMVSRAEAKIERIQTMQDSAEKRADGYSAAADNIAERFAGGQPILVGHHSERKARKDADRIDRNMRNAAKEREKIQHYNWKLAGVAHHANRKGCDRTRANRIKKLLAELRDVQRRINHNERYLKLWQKIDGDTDQERRQKATAHYSGLCDPHQGSLSPDGCWHAHDRGKMTTDEVISQSIAMHERGLSSIYRPRWIMHILNRLAYEYAEQGATARFDGDITAAIIQVFTRTHGADKPKATKNGDAWVIKSPLSLPVHIGDGKELSLTADQWADLMQSVGYEVPAPKAKAAPILNFRTSSLQANRFGTLTDCMQIKMTKADYSAIYSEHRGVFMSACERFRFKICLDPNHDGPAYQRGWVAVFLTDSKTHEAPAGA